MCPIRGNPDWLKGDDPPVTQKKQKQERRFVHNPRLATRIMSLLETDAKQTFSKRPQLKIPPKVFLWHINKELYAFLLSVCDVETPARHKMYNES